MLKIKIKDGGIAQLLWKLQSSLVRAGKRGLEEAAKKVAKDYGDRLFTGRNADGSPIKPVKETTMDQPIRRGGPDKRIRKTVNPSKGVAMYATGKLASSLTPKRTGKNQMVIQPSDSLGKIKLSVNATTYGRDPITVAKPQLDIAEEEILREIDKILKF